MRCLPAVALVICIMFSGICFAQEAAKTTAPKYKEVKFDSDNDGVMDSVNVYDEKDRLVKRGYDTNGDKIPDRWQSYNPNTGMPDVVPSDSEFELR